ncbi:MAG: hypothetical protein K2I06_05335 [Ruminococcus sp.]|nr:hypothetical protein [Ruminococcus sp.]
MNTNTQKFHYSTCSNVDLMKNKNKIAFVGERDERAMSLESVANHDYYTLNYSHLSS